MAKWNKFPHDQKAITYAGDALKKNWDALHKGDNEPYPKDAVSQRETKKLASRIEPSRCARVSML